MMCKLASLFQNGQLGSVFLPFRRTLKTKITGGSTAYLKLGDGQKYLSRWSITRKTERSNHYISISYTCHESIIEFLRVWLCHCLRHFAL